MFLVNAEKMKEKILLIDDVSYVSIINVTQTSALFKLGVRFFSFYAILFVVVFHDSVDEPTFYCESQKMNLNVSNLAILVGRMFSLKTQIDIIRANTLRKI